jgi:3-oxoacyl-[acyl-carrier protein] reductase
MTDESSGARVALVTGGGNGVGEAIVQALHGGGYRVAIADIDEAASQRVASRLDPAGQTAFALGLDVRHKRQFEAALARIVARWGAVQVLVNNAAVTIARPVMEISPEEFDDVIAVNLRGTFFGCQVFGAYFGTNGHGRIINMASLAGQNGGTATGAHYAASKGGIVTLTKVFARDLGPAGVTVNAIAPGPIDSPMVHRTVSPERLVGLKAGIPVGQIGDAAFIGQLVLQLASPAAAFATGATWDVNGGLYMR